TLTNTPTSTSTPTSTPTPLATNIASPTATPTQADVPPNQNPPPPSGQPGTPCTASIGGVCSLVGTNLQGTWTRTGSGTFTVTATGPADTVVGGLPAIFIPTTVAVEGFQCGPVTVAVQTTCTGTTIGNPLQGATVTVRFPIAGGGTSDVTGLIFGS